MEKSCRVSVLIPVYNSEKYLRQCIESVLKQTLPDFELILCDDGSTDTSGKICDEYRDKDERIQVIHKENEGNFAARRSLLEHASGKYVLFVDSDDWIASETLEKTVSFAEENQTDVVMFGHRIVDDKGVFISEKCHLYPDNAVFRDEGLKSIYVEFATGNRLNYLWDKLIRRECFTLDSCDNQKPKCNFKGGDKVQMVALLRNIVSFSYLDIPLYCYRRSDNGMGRNFKLRYFQDLIFVHGEVNNFIKEQLNDEFDVRIRFLSYFISNLIGLTFSAAHNGTFSSCEIIKKFEEMRKSDLYLEAVASGAKVNGNLLYRITYFMFRHKMDRELIWFLRNEKSFLNAFHYQSLDRIGE